MRKLQRVALLYGGRSGEHEVSLRSAASVLRNLDSKRFEVLVIGIDREGVWHLHENVDVSDTSGRFSGASLPIDLAAPQVVLVPHRHAQGGKLHFIEGSRAPVEFDVVFPVLHGPLYEDGALQGLLELAEVPYVGCGILASSVGMDKETAKVQAQAQGIRIVPYLAVHRSRWSLTKKTIVQQVTDELSFPVFVKPSNMGSSVGVHKVKKPEDLAAAIEDALQYDTKVLIEKSIAAREIEVSALEGLKAEEPVLTSIAGEIVPTHEFYNYEAKYLDENGAKLLIPAEIDNVKMLEVRTIASQVFLALSCQGYARVDFFMDKYDGTVYFNEINTLPGFTSISMYPKMWEASGLQYGDLLSKLIDLAMKRHQDRSELRREWETPTAAP